MSTTARKARKRAHRAAGYPEATAYFKEAKRPNRHYLSKSDEKKLRKQTRLMSLIDSLRGKGKTDDEIKAELGVTDTEEGKK